MTNALDDFRNAMRKLAASVHVVTTQHEGERGGLTATAVCSVSFEPMMMLVCVNRSVSCFDLIERAGKIAINILSSEDAAIGLQFGAPDQVESRFSQGDWTEIEGMPKLASAAASIALNITSHQDVGTHRVYFGEVIAASVGGEDRTALLYADGAFGTTQPL